MKYVEEYRDGAIARQYADSIARIVTRPWTIMEICGGQTHAIVKYGIDELLPPADHAGPWAGMPGLRHSGRVDRQGPAHCRAARRHFLLLRRHAARARILCAGRSKFGRCTGGRFVQRQSCWRRCAHRLFADGRGADRQTESRQAGGLLRCRLRDHCARQCHVGLSRPASAA